MTSIRSIHRAALLRRAILLLAVLAVLGCPAHRAAALGSQPTRFAGVIQAIDYKNKTVTFQAGPQGGSLSLQWHWTTEFYADGKKVKADAFKTGMHVKVKYLSPLFGREYATKIELDPPKGPPVG